MTARLKFVRGRIILKSLRRQISLRRKIVRTLEGVNIGWDETVWRYCSVERFEWIAANNQIYFASANQFVDPFEGAVAVQLNPPPADPRYAEMDFGEKAFFELKRLTKLNCWHRAAYESDAMWRLYAGQSKGVAICSTPNRMREAFRPFRLKPEYGAEDLWGGPVQYIDLTQVRMRAGMLERFFCKHRAFEWEREFRLAISLRTAEEFALKVPPDGITVDVDLNLLIDHVIVGPAIPSNQHDHLAALARNAGFGDRLRFSTLLGKPRYT